MIVYCIMTTDLLKHLNPTQQQAVVATEGPILILAGAGSGKTRVLNYKAAYLVLEKNISLENILMVTFTNKAANEMKERISKLLNSYKLRFSTSLPSAGTFHSICAKILRHDGQKIGIPPNFIIYDEQDSKEAIKQALDRLNLDKKKLNPNAVATTISEAKNELISALEYPQYTRGFFQEEVARLYIEYQKILQKNNALDFDDLLFTTVELLQKFKEIALYYQNKFQYILVDEYQDTNHAQYELTKLLAKKWRNICVVGDASQSIYSWRGADFRNILAFRKDYPNVCVFHLEQNYRSSQTILDASYQIISKNRTHPILKLWTEKEGGESIAIYQAKSEHGEAEFVANEISSLKYHNPSIRFSDFVVLYRTNAQSRVIEEVFLQNGIPYVLVGGIRFYERKEVKDVISYLRLMINLKDSISYKRIEKIGKKRLEKFIHFRDSFLTNYQKKECSTLAVIDAILETIAYLDIYDKESEDGLSRIENIKELRSVAAEFPNLNQFLENVSLVELEYLPDHPSKILVKKDAVNLMTLHAAKGLEFSVVFMVGMEEGLFPHSRSLSEPVELEEERRLCYVGMTRAINKLYMTYTQQRLYFGQRNSNQISRFVIELPEHLITSVGNNMIP